MPVFPYKIKNHLERFPYTTVALIAINLTVYILTTDSLHVLRSEIADHFAFGFGISPWINFFVAKFLHAFPLHLIVNMAALWIFGPAVEERVGSYRFLTLYFFAGFTGSILQAGLSFALFHEVRPSLGASGCIMGLAGACWYLFPWSRVCVWYWIGWFWMGVVEISAFWVVGAYFIMDLLNGFLDPMMGWECNVGHFAHVGGVIGGVLLCILFRSRRDTEVVSELRAVQFEMKDPDRISLPILNARLEEEPENLELLLEITSLSQQQNQPHALDIAMETAGPGLLSTAPDFVLDYLLNRRGRVDLYPPGKLLSLAERMLASGRWGPAVNLYRRLADSLQRTPTGEIAQLRLAECQWSKNRDTAACEQALTEFDRIYPLSLHRTRVETLRRQLRSGLAS
jgi:membrane associated rhomboid family serine protease